VAGRRARLALAGVLRGGDLTTSTLAGICLRCEVRAECLEKALARDERFGIWGGNEFSEREIG